MNLDQSQSKTLSSLKLKPSHRTFGEQAVGGALFLLISLGFLWASLSTIQSSLPAVWIRQIFLDQKLFSTITAVPPWALCHLLTAFSIWNLWRRKSLSELKIETAIFLIQLILSIAWTTSFFIFHESLLALTALLFLCSNTLLAALLYWKKERFSGQALVPCFVWIFYVMGVNMAICISNP